MADATSFLLLASLSRRNLLELKLWFHQEHPSNQMFNLLVSITVLYPTFVAFVHFCIVLFF